MPLLAPQTGPVDELRRQGGDIGHRRAMQSSPLPLIDMRRQHGVFTRAQLRAFGWAVERIASYVALGRWVRHSEDVFSLAGAPLTPIGRLWAAYLSCGPRAVIVGPSALALHGRGPMPELPWIAVPTNRHVEAGDFRLIRQRRPVEQHARVRGLLASGPEESLTTCLRLLPLPEARALLHRALREGWADAGDLANASHISAGQRGAPQLRRLAAEAATRAWSEGERRLLELATQAGLGGFRVNHPIHDAQGLIGIGDLVYEEQHLVVEFDGRAHHSDEVAFQRDRTRQNRLVNAGWAVLRFTWDDVVHRPDKVIDAIRTALARATA